MDTVRFGRQVRALRRRRGWRQVDLSVAADMSRGSVSRIERGHADETTLAALDAVARALSARLDVGLSWNGEGLDRLLDAAHAAIVELVARELRALEWDVAVEVTFNIRGERGSIDILAFHPATGVILVVEVKSVVPDLQATVFTLDRKSRLAVEIARTRGWHGVAVGRILVVADGRTSRRRVAAHEATFAAAFPARGVAVRRWLRSPDPGRRFSGIWFLAIARGASARQRVAPARRVPRA
jgi:transcriptional regulator with XRE-family HTH domain